MATKTVRDINVNGKRVLLRVDFNVPMEKDGRITSLARLKASLPTIRYLTQHGAKVMLLSHLGRPGGKVVESMRLRPVRVELEKLLGQPVAYADDCVSPTAQAAVQQLEPGQVLLLENVRFHPGDEKNDPEFSRQLAALADIFVEDAFGVVHRAHASTVGVTEFLPSVAGLLLEKELEMMNHVLTAPHHPLVAIMGGAKISDKVGVVENMLGMVDVLLIGGGMAATFLRARGMETGASLIEQDSIAFAAKAMQDAERRGVRVVLPSDVVVADKFEAAAVHKVVPDNQIPVGWMILDIGPETLKTFKREIAKAKTVFWNGPMGVFEMPAFSKGTRELVDALASLKGVTTIVGGGSTAEVVESLGMEDKMTHVSTGGGATLECLAGETLPGVAALKKPQRA
ncbi:MAG: phosphoglycerate kinase [Dehalococcoidia bacterium]|nr:phosphoglycerate kinase [Dehalococcoidia bacterium]